MILYWRQKHTIPEKPPVQETYTDDHIQPVQQEPNNGSYQGNSSQGMAPV